MLAALAAAVAVALAACGCLAVSRSLRAARLTPEDRVAARAAGAAAKDWAWYVGGVGITALVLAFLAFFLSANDGAVREQYLDWDAIKAFLPFMWKGLWLNIKVFVVAEVLVLVWGLVLALARIFPGKAGRPVRFLAVAYIDLFRGFPAIITIYLVVLGFQAGDVPPFNQLEGQTKLFWLCTTALVLVYGAYVAEVYRSGLESIHWSQTAAARSLGLSYGADDALRHHPAGGAPDHPAVAQRLHRAAEGHRAAERRGPARGAQPGPAGLERAVQPVAQHWPPAWPSWS